MWLSRPLLILWIVLLGASCAPPPLYHKAGIAIAQVQADEADCTDTAMAAVPVKARTRYIDPVYSARRVCDAAGHCGTFPILISPGRIVTEDINEGKRAVAAKACMADKGYARVTLPACDPAPDTIAPRQPVLTDRSCAVRTGSGDWWIVTPGA